MSNWIHRLLNPHCEECVIERQEARICNSCEALRAEIASLRMERDRLLEHIISPTKTEAPVVEQGELKPIMPQYIPWHIKRKMLEEEDKAKAKAQRDAIKPDAPLSVEELEEQLNVD